MSCSYKGAVDVKKLQLQKSCNYNNVVIAKVLVGGVGTLKVLGARVLQLWRGQVWRCCRCKDVTTAEVSIAKVLQLRKCRNYKSVNL